MTEPKPQMAAPLTAAALIAQQVGGNAMRDGLFLTHFPVQTLPYFVAGAALLAIFGARLMGGLLTRLGPAHVTPLLFAANAALFLVEWALLDAQPQASAVLLYLHSTVLGAIAISAFWSLLNERFDPHSAKPMMARVAGAATLGGLVGGVSAERIAALLPHGALFGVLSAVGGISVAGVLLVGPGTRRGGAPVAEPESDAGWTHFRNQPLVRDLALVIALAAMLAALVDYLLKAEAVGYFGKGPQLVRFFGLFYSGTSLAAVLIQGSLGGLALRRLGLAGSVATHPAVVGSLGLLGFVLPIPWRGILPRALDLVVRNSVFRAGYELHYTPLAETTKRSAKSLIDVGCDCVGKGVGALTILMLSALAPVHAFAAVNVAAAVVAGGELFITRRLRPGYVAALVDQMRRHENEEPSGGEPLSDFTVAQTMIGLDRESVMKAVGSDVARTSQTRPDPVVAALVELRSGDVLRIRAALRTLPHDPLLIGALVQLLARHDIVQRVITALTAYGPRAAGEMVSVLLDPATPDVIRRRLPLALKFCASQTARDGLFEALGTSGFETRIRCGRALLTLTDEHPDLLVPFPAALTLVDKELDRWSDTAAREGTPALVREHVFNLLALALDREPARIAAVAFTVDNAFAQGTALEYLETVLPPDVFAKFRPLLSASEPRPASRRTTGDVRADLIRVGTTMTVSLDELQRQLKASADEG